MKENIIHPSVRWSGTFCFIYIIIEISGPIPSQPNLPTPF